MDKKKKELRRVQFAAQEDDDEKTHAQTPSMDQFEDEKEVIDVSQDFQFEKMELFKAVSDLRDNEEDLKYIAEISELTSKLEDEIGFNQLLNEKIDAKNKELEMCNNKIQELMEENKQMKEARTR